MRRNKNFWVRNHPTSLAFPFCSICCCCCFFFCLSFSRYKFLQKVKKHRKTSVVRSLDIVSFRDSLGMRTTSKKIKLSLTRFSKNQVYIFLQYSALWTEYLLKLNRIGVLGFITPKTYNINGATSRFVHLEKLA